MTATQKKCLAVAIKTGNKKLAVKLALLANVYDENCVVLSSVYEDISAHVSAHEFAGYLSALEGEGFYRKSGEGFGRIRQQKAD